MHDSALDKLRVFRSVYLDGLESTPLSILDVGSAVAHPGHDSNRTVMENAAWTMRGLDIEAGINVDIVVAEPYDWREVPAGSVDVVTCSQVFEHAEYFWITMMEISRVLKVHGLAFINAPGSGPLHRYPVDCWRFYDDAFPALARYAGLDLLEAQVQWAPAYRKGLQWRDATGIMQRPVRTPEEEQAMACRIAAAKLSAKATIGVAELGAVGAAAVEAAASVIGPRQGQGALEKRAGTLMADASALSRKAFLIRRELRSIGEIIRRPIRDLRL
jgi:SAM-dependent methyltransferase